MADSETKDIKPEVVEDLEPEKTIEDEQLEAALKAAEAESKGEQDPVTTEPGKPAPEAKQEPAKTLAKEPAKPQLVPVGVVTALRRENSELKHNNATLVGQVQGMQMQSETAAANVANVETPKSGEEILDDIDKSLLEISRKLDDGDITNEDAELKRIDLKKQERTVLTDMNKPLPPVEQAQQVLPVTDLGLEEHLNELAQSHPVLFELNDQQLEPLKNLAYEQAAREGSPIYEGAIGTKNLRSRMAVLATQFYGKREETVSDDGVQGGIAPEELAKRDAKLKIAQTHPKDVSQLGSTTGVEAVSDEEALARLENMTADEQISYLEANPALMQRIEGL